MNMELAKVNQQHIRVRVQIEQRTLSTVDGFLICAGDEGILETS